MSKTVYRLDELTSMDWLTTPFKRTPEGFLKGRAIVTNVGVFLYQNGIGNVRRELRLPEEVFSADSVESLSLKPITNNHPNEVVTPDNIKKYQVGNCGGYADDQSDGFHVAIDLIIQEVAAIDDVLNGKSALSCGYKCDIEDESGVWCGMTFDCIQRNIRYNHIAIVNEARAGDAAKIKLAGMDAILLRPAD